VALLFNTDDGDISWGLAGDETKSANGSHELKNNQVVDHEKSIQLARDFVDLMRCSS
jgi:hypothetical protein